MQLGLKIHIQTICQATWTIYLVTLLGKLFCFLIGMQYVGCPCNNNEVKSFCDDFWCVHTGAEEIIFPWDGLS